jgi:hypothetical protein
MIDEKYLNLEAFIHAVSPDIGQIEDSVYKSTAMSVEEIHIDMPVELDLNSSEEKGIAMGVAPPLYYAATSLLPVFHNIKLTITVDNS